jgi:hydroxyethylthiazole kinase-like uncharacterized protein yjeF
MKIFTPAQIHELYQYTVEHDSIKSIDLTERIAKSLTRAIMDEWTEQTPVVVFAGPNENGAQAMAVARLLAEAGYKVAVYLFNIHNELNDNCKINRQRIEDGKRVAKFTEIKEQFDPPELSDRMLIVDGLFGADLKKPLVGGFASLVKYINQSPAQVVSIDVPSGLMSEDNTNNIRSNIIKADLTLTIQQKKLCMMFADCRPFIGRLRVIDVRLSPDYIQKASTPYTTLEESFVRRLQRERDDFANKGTMGSALIIAGSYGMAGAAILATRACYRAGAGKVTVHVPRLNNDIMQISVPEAIVQPDHEDEYFSESVDSDRYDAVGIGPGLGQNENTAIALISQIRRAQCPVVVDADAINILANHQAWTQQLPQGTILTPHPKEFDRICDSNVSSDFDRLYNASQMAQRLQGYILLKGHHSALCLPDGRVLFNTTGNSGMATAGSGDVLTGIITGLLARGYNRQDACILGMYLHGLAGDIAAKDLGKESLMAGDLIRYLPKAFLRLND